MSDSISAPKATSTPATSVTEQTGSAAGSGHRRLEAAKADLIERAIQLAGDNVSGDSEPGQHGPAEVAAVVNRFYRHVSPEDLVDRDPADVLGAAVSQLQLAAHRTPGTAAVRAFTPALGADGWSSPHTVVQVITDDMPFLVDSLTGDLANAGRAVHLVIHPQFYVRRDVSGHLLEVLTRDQVRSGEVPADALMESWIHLEIDRETDPDDLSAIEHSLGVVLLDVRGAVEDWGKMRRAAVAIADELHSSPPTSIEQKEVTEAEALLRWLSTNHFTFLGYREYDLTGPEGEEKLVAVPGTGLGILRADPTSSKEFANLPPAVRTRAREPHVLVLTKANSRSTVHRRAYLDYVGVKKFDAEGNVTGERRFLGLFTSAAYTQQVLAIPVLSRKVEQVMARSGLRREGHSYKDLMRVLETYPRDELFQVGVDALFDTATAVLNMHERRQTRVFLRRDPYARFVSALVYLPRERYTTQVRLRMESVLAAEFGSTQVDYTTRVGEDTSARVHFVVRMPTGVMLPEVDEAQLEAQIVDASRAWEDDFADALVEWCGEEDAAGLIRAYGSAFPEGYKVDFVAAVGVADVLRLRDLTAQADMAAVSMSLYSKGDGPVTEPRFKLYRLGAPISLSAVLPILSRMGVEVTDERPYEIHGAHSNAWVYDFGLRFDAGLAFDLTTLKQRFEDTFAAAWAGRIDADGFNALVVSAGLTCRQVTVLRAYARYLRQVGSAFSQDYLESTLVANVEIVRLLVTLFDERFDPAFTGDRDAATQQRISQVEAALDAVSSLDQDRILRSFLGVITATVRTNAFQQVADPAPYLSFKLDPARVPDLPKPLPRYEIWVYSPRVEGVHLRFGPVARGGLRWSDRREDFRTEVLGLVKAQMVKNAVIVPVGAKGGFVAKIAPDASMDREAWLAEGIACYRSFISGLLDLTDNLVAGVVVPPVDVVRHDGDDTYLVVAADKGTATFSDIANEVALSYGFWLGDAFASGGSVGYDHKAMGITARGAWESVRRHFRELGLDTQSQDFTVVGVGDMSGDVFGNGMLLSEHIRLVAAFDHRHVFLDPNPDGAISFTERARLFGLPRSSWAEYNQDLISVGGGIHSRTAKSIPITAEVRDALGIAEGVGRLTPAELMRSILSAPIDLLWNGGIGTYIKATTESNGDVGDKSNDSIRVDGGALRARVLGEGGNLGATQLGRIEAAREGVRLNTDAIDNSAGVDTSDHEVNIKILLDQAVRDGQLTETGRNELLALMTDEIATLVLTDNYEQNIALGNARAQAPSMLNVHHRFIRRLESLGELDREVEFLPSDAQFEALAATGQGLTSPELAVLLAYAKITLTHSLSTSGLADESWFSGLLRSYFPTELVTGFDGRLDSHPLRNQIITTVAVNDLVNRGGVTFAYRAMEETGAEPVELVRAYVVAREVFALPTLWRGIEDLDATVPTLAQIEMLLECRRLLDRATRWVLQSRGGTVDVEAEIARFTGDVARISAVIPELLVGVERNRLSRRAQDFRDLGAPADMALQVAGLLDVFGALDCIDAARTTGTDALEVARLYFTLSERYDVDEFLNRITRLPRTDRWTALARGALRSDLYGALIGMTKRVITSGSGPSDDPVKRIEAWELQQAEGLARARATLDEIASQEESDLATLSVALRTVRTLVAQGG